MRSWLVSFGVLVVLVGCEPGDLPPSDAGPGDAPRDDAPRFPRDAGTPPEDIDGFLQWWMGEGGISGLAAAVVDDGEVVLSITEGMATETMPVDDHTLFIVASVSKTFCGALLLQLAEDGRLDLDADVSTYLGYTFRNPSFPDDVITTRMLAAHTSSLVDDFLDLGPYQYTSDPTVSLADFAREYGTEGELETHWGSRAPGTSYSYANAGFGVLGAIVEAASGEDFRALSEAELFEPLALDGAGWFLSDVDPAHLADEMVWDGHRFRATPQHGFAFYPAGSLRISLVGITRWVQAHVDGTLDGTTFLTTESIAMTRTAQFESVRTGQGFVWERDVIGGETFWGHSGSTFGASANIEVRDDGDAIVLLTNSDAYLRNRFGDPTGSAAMHAILERLVTYLAP
jgi:CubicO group peptidase (beta-lactamase class C family)